MLLLLPECLYLLKHLLQARMPQTPTNPMVAGFFFGRFGQTFERERCGEALFQFDLRQAIGEVPFPGLRVCSKL